LTADYAQRNRWRIVGLMSGTSADAIDAALVQIDETGMRLLRFLTVPYDADTREAIFRLMEDRAGVRELSRTHVRLGRLFAQAALAVLQGESADLVASHGQTVAHLPGEDPPSTLQIGEPSVIAQRVGAPCVSDFRPADMALGGQAAPLVPAFDAWLLRNQGPKLDRVAINLGGMANCTWVPHDDTRPVEGWDSGPGNVLLDALAEQYCATRCDLDGALASSGAVDLEILGEMLRHPYFHQDGPRSTGRETFGRDFLQPYLGRLQPADLMRTALALTCRSLVESLRPHTLGPAFEAVVGGGGVHNPVLLQDLHGQLSNLPGFQGLRSFADFGIDPDAREACAFAYLGHQTMLGRPGSLPSVTGARRGAVLGRISFP